MPRLLIPATHGKIKMREFSLPSKIVKASTDHFVIGDLSDFSALANREEIRLSPLWAQKAWVGNMTGAEAGRAAATGHEPSAIASEKFIREVEDLVKMPSAKHVIVDDVTGAFPNVPAFIAGQPMNMRRRMSREVDNAPIALVADTTSSAVISAADMAKRGAVLMALARALSSVRPVELYAMTALDARGKGAVIQLWRIETAPMDLARAAFLLSHPAATRGVQYSNAFRYGYSGGWPYLRREKLSETEMATTVKTALPHIEATVCVPAVHMRDGLISSPVEWLKAKLAEMSSEDMEDAA